MTPLSFLFPSRPRVNINIGSGRPEELIYLAEQLESIASGLRAKAGE